MQPERSRPQGSRKFSPNKWLKPQILLVFSIFGLIYRPAQIARACGRVSVGADPDKRPVKRRIKTGSRRRTGEPRLHGGSRLKATTDRAFLVSVGPSKGRQPKRLVFLAGRADRDLPFQTMATLTATERLRTPSRNLEALTRFGENVSITAHHPIGRAGLARRRRSRLRVDRLFAFPSRGQDTGRSHEADWYGAGDRALRRGGGDDRPYLGIPPGATRSRT